MRSRNQKGFSLIELGVGVGIMIGLSIATYSLLSQYFANQNKQSAAVGMLQVRTDLEKILSSEDTYKALLNDAKAGGATNASSLACMIGSSDCSAVSRNPIRLIDKNNKVVPTAGDPSSASRGLTVDGTPCDEFNGVAGNNRCPYRYEIYWRPICPPAPDKCTKPSVELGATLRFVPEPDSKITSRLDLAKFSIKYIRREVHDKVSDTCASMGGTMVGNQCVTNFGQPCPDGQFVIGFEANGLRRCGLVKAFQCPDGQVLTSLRSNGDYQCAPGCASSNASSGTWFNL